MTPISDISPQTQSSGSQPTQAFQLQSVVAQHKVIASQKNDAASNTNNNTSAEQRPPSIRDMQRAAQHAQSKLAANNQGESQSRSILEATETAQEDRKITAAFASRRDMGELLSVIRDPQDRVLPEEPKDLLV